MLINQITNVELQKATENYMKNPKVHPREKLRYIRKALDMRLADFAELTDVSSPTLSNFERAVTEDLTLASIRKIAKVIGVTVVEFYGEFIE